MNNNKRICITLSNTEDVQLTERAQKCGLSKAEYIRELVLNGQVINSLSEAKIRGMIAEIYGLAEQIEDMPTRKLLKKEADQLWQSLK